MARYMVIENIRDNCLDAVYRRLQQKGRLLPQGLHYVDSWLTRDGKRCFQLMETDDFALFESWTAQWNDLVSFEIFELGGKPSPEAVAHV